jgi:hypothetical protein
MAVLMVGAISRTTLLGLLGFVVMLVSTTVGLSALRGTSRVRRAASRPGPPSGSMLDRFGTPWRRRHGNES